VPAAARASLPALRAGRNAESKVPPGRGLAPAHLQGCSGAVRLSMAPKKRSAPSKEPSEPSTAEEQTARGAKRTKVGRAPTPRRGSESARKRRGNGQCVCVRPRNCSQRACGSRAMQSPWRPRLKREPQSPPGQATGSSRGEHSHSTLDLCQAPARKSSWFWAPRLDR